MLVIPEKKKLVLNTSVYTAVLSAIPHAKAFDLDGVQHVALHHGPEESLVLKNLGFKVPEPIRSYYLWPARFKPMDHQKDTSAFLSMNRKALCLNAPGTGKTISALWAADYLLEEGVVKRVLIVAPLSTVSVVWGREMYHHLPHRSFSVLVGSRDKRKDLLAQGAQYCVINHDGFTSMQANLTDFDLVIYDEATALKTPGSQRYKIFSRWMTQHNPWLWMLTGTPISQNPTDAWTLARLVNSPTVPRSFTAFRDMVMNKITTFKWIPRANALETCKQVLQPSIRFSLDECMSIPDTNYIGRQCSLTPAQQKAFKQMEDHSMVLFKNKDVTAANAAVALGKLIQICCIAEDTPVLTRRGWTPIQHVSSEDTLWDGEEWVTCDGSVCLGYKHVIQCGDVAMTPDHKVLSTVGWREAKDFEHGEPSKRFTRASVRLPDGCVAGGLIDRAYHEGSMGMSLRMREHRRAGEPVPTGRGTAAPSELWVPSRQRDTQNVWYSSLQYLDKHASPLPRYWGQGLAQLRRAWHHGVQAVAGVVRELLGGHAGRILVTVNARAQGQLRQLHAQELRVGNATRAGEQPTQQRGDRHAKGQHDGDTGGAGVWSETDNGVQKNRAREQGLAASRKVYDIVNCGPRNRFVVRGSAGQPSIVHNCGVLYGNDKEHIGIDAGPRLDTLKDLLNEIGDKTIVFCPLRGVQDWLHTELVKAGYDVESVHGDVGKTERNTIFSDFQNTERIRVLLAHPRVAAHGLTLTRAKDIIWFAPIYSLEQYEQANARIRRLTTSGKTNVWHIWATKFEAELYRRLRFKQRVLGEFLKLVQGINDEV